MSLYLVECSEEDIHFVEVVETETAQEAAKAVAESLVKTGCLPDDEDFFYFAATELKKGGEPILNQTTVLRGVLVNKGGKGVAEQCRSTT